MITSYNNNNNNNGRGARAESYCKSDQNQEILRSEEAVQTNRVFETNQRKFYEELDVKETSNEEELDPEKAKQFWNKLWSQDVKDNKSTE